MPPATAAPSALPLSSLPMPVMIDTVADPSSSSSSSSFAASTTSPMSGTTSTSSKPHTQSKIQHPLRDFLTSQDTTALQKPNAYIIAQREAWEKYNLEKAIKMSQMTAREEEERRKGDSGSSSSGASSSSSSAYELVVVSTSSAQGSAGARGGSKPTSNTGNNTHRRISAYAGGTAEQDLVAYQQTSRGSSSASAAAAAQAKAKAAQQQAQIDGGRPRRPSVSGFSSASAQAAALASASAGPGAVVIHPASVSVPRPIVKRASTTQALSISPQGQRHHQGQHHAHAHGPSHSHSHSYSQSHSQSHSHSHSHSASTSFTSTSYTHSRAGSQSNSSITPSSASSHRPPLVSASTSPTLSLSLTRDRSNSQSNPAYNIPSHPAHNSPSNPAYHTQSNPAHHSPSNPAYIFPPYNSGFSSAGAQAQALAASRAATTSVDFNYKRTRADSFRSGALAIMPPPSVPLISGSGSGFTTGSGSYSTAGSGSYSSASGMLSTTPTSSASAQAQVYAQKQALMRAQAQVAQVQSQAQGGQGQGQGGQMKTQPMTIPHSGQMRRQSSQVGISGMSVGGSGGMMSAGSPNTGTSASTSGMHAHMQMRGRSGSFSNGIGMGNPTVIKRKTSMMRGVSDSVVGGGGDGMRERGGSVSGDGMRERRGSVSLPSPLGMGDDRRGEDIGGKDTEEMQGGDEQGYANLEVAHRQVEKKPSTMQMLQRKASSMLGRKGSMMLQRKASSLSVSSNVAAPAFVNVVVEPTPSLLPPLSSASFSTNDVLDHNVLNLHVAHDTPIISSLKPNKPSILALSSNPSGRKMKQVRNLGDLRSLLSGCAMGGKAAQMRRWRCCNSKGGCGREVVGGWGVYGETTEIPYYISCTHCHAPHCRACLSLPILSTDETWRKDSVPKCCAELWFLVVFEALDGFDGLYMSVGASSSSSSSPTSTSNSNSTSTLSLTPGSGSGSPGSSRSASPPGSTPATTTPKSKAREERERREAYIRLLLSKTDRSLKAFEDAFMRCLRVVGEVFGVEDREEGSSDDESEGSNEEEESEEESDDDEDDEDDEEESSDDELPTTKTSTAMKPTPPPKNPYTSLILTHLFTSSLLPEAINVMLADKDPTHWLMHADTYVRVMEMLRKAGRSVDNGGKVEDLMGMRMGGGRGVREGVREDLRVGGGGHVKGDNSEHDEEEEEEEEEEGGDKTLGEILGGLEEVRPRLMIVADKVRFPGTVERCHALCDGITVLMFQSLEI